MGKVYEKISDTLVKITETVEKVDNINTDLRRLKDKSESLQNQIDRFIALKAEVDKDIAEAIKLGVKEPTAEAVG